MKPVASYKFETFDEMRARAAREWTALPLLYNPVSAPLQAKIDDWVANKKQFLNKYLSQK